MSLLPRPPRSPRAPRPSRAAHRTAPALAAPALAALALAALAACAPADSTSTASGSASGSASAGGASAPPSSTSCAKDQLKLHTAGRLTIATDNPVYEPWFKDNKPANGQGFESAVAYAVATQLGFAANEVTWVTASFNSVTAPGAKTFDFDINEVSVTDERKQAVDFSSGYYTVEQAVVTLEGNKIANAKSIADLKGAKLGAQVGTTSYRTITDIIAPTAKPAVFNSNDDAKLALTNGQIDGLVLDLPTASFEANVDLKNGVLVGKFDTGATPEQFGLVLDKGSALTPCVSAAVDALAANGTLEQLEQQWLKDYLGTPVLK
jgi:polar amino acid transport system substrate-binding protein